MIGEKIMCVNEKKRKLFLENKNKKF